MPHQAASVGVTARAFVDARLKARALPNYPGPMPADLAAAYAVQDAAIALWPDEIVGWKIGLAPAEMRSSLGTDRIAGPIFRQHAIHLASGATAELGVLVGGFAAVEAEFVLTIGRDQDLAKSNWSLDEAADMLSAVHIGVELAGSPFPGINDFGPAVTASDFGNNAGLVVGPEFANWRDLDWSRAVARTLIDGASVGEGNAAMLPGGPMAALAFILHHCAERGRPLRKGQWISSGAVTGVHRIEAGQNAELSFGDAGVLYCRAVPARGEQAPAAAGAGA